MASHRWTFVARKLWDHHILDWFTNCNMRGARWKWLRDGLKRPIFGIEQESARVRFQLRTDQSEKRDLELQSVCVNCFRQIQPTYSSSAKPNGLRLEPRLVSSASPTSYHQCNERREIYAYTVHAIGLAMCAIGYQRWEWVNHGEPVPISIG